MFLATFPECVHRLFMGSILPPMCYKREEAQMLKRLRAKERTGYVQRLAGTRGPLESANSMGQPKNMDISI